jgi:hypothetical protein
VRRCSVSLDDAATTQGRLVIARLALTGIFQWLGYPEVPQITDVGKLRRPYIGRQTGLERRAGPPRMAWRSWTQGLRLSPDSKPLACSDQSLRAQRLTRGVTRTGAQPCGLGSSWSARYELGSPPGDQAGKQQDHHERHGYRAWVELEPRRRSREALVQQDGIDRAVYIREHG